MLIYVVSVLMVVYLMLFGYAWGGKEDEAPDVPLLSQVPDQCSSSSTSDITVRMTREEAGSVIRSLSFASTVRLDRHGEVTDDMTPVRSLSVA